MMYEVVIFDLDTGEFIATKRYASESAAEEAAAEWETLLLKSNTLGVYVDGFLMMEYA